MTLKIGRFPTVNNLTLSHATTVANIRINIRSAETAVSGEHFCCWQYGSIFIRFHIVVSINESEKSSEANDENRF